MTASGSGAMGEESGRVRGRRITGGRICDCVMRGTDSEMCKTVQLDPYQLDPRLRKDPLLRIEFEVRKKHNHVTLLKKKKDGLTAEKGIAQALKDKAQSGKVSSRAVTIPVLIRSIRSIRSIRLPLLHPITSKSHPAIQLLLSLYRHACHTANNAHPPPKNQLQNGSVSRILLVSSAPPLTLTLCQFAMH